MPDQARELASGRRVWVDLTEAEHAALETVASEQEQEVETVATEMLGAAIAGHARRASGHSGLSASVKRFHRALRARDEEQGQ